MITVCNSDLCFSTQILCWEFACFSSSSLREGVVITDSFKERIICCQTMIESWRVEKEDEVIDYILDANFGSLFAVYDCLFSSLLDSFVFPGWRLPNEVDRNYLREDFGRWSGWIAIKVDDGDHIWWWWSCWRWDFVTDSAISTRRTQIDKDCCLILEQSSLGYPNQNPENGLIELNWCRGCFLR